MKERTKSLLKDSFGSLVSNDRAISAAKTSPIWLTIIIFLVAVLLPVIPITVYYGSQNGSSSISRYSYNLEKTIPDFALTFLKEDKGLVVEEDKTLNIGQEYTTDPTPVYTYKNDSTGREELRVFVSPLTSKDKDAVKAYLTTIADFKEKVRDADPNVKNDKDVYSKPSALIFFKDIFAMQLYQPDTETARGAISGNYKAFKAGDDIVKMLVTVKDINIEKPEDAEDIKAILSNNHDYAKGVVKNFKTFLNKTYEEGKKRSTLFSTLIFSGIYLGLSLLMALIIWLLTRGKNNPFNYLTLLTTFKIESWASLCPAILGMILGLVIPVDMSLKMMMFIAPLGFRVMFLLTKQLRPMQ